ncbi:MAG TPA: flagellin [Gemmatimonadales bacterium]|nr:flagellin [Gemmatimonadales bacterium]
MPSIQTNTAANNAYKNLSMTSGLLEKSITKLSSGFRINRSADDAAGLAIANKLRSDVRALQQAQRNASQANSMLQVADGALNTVATILDRMKELAAQANSANVGQEAPKLQAEFDSLVSEIDRIAATTTYNGTALTNGGFGSGLDKTNSTAWTTAAGNVADIKLNGAAVGTYTFASGAAAATLTRASDSVSQIVTGISATARSSVVFSNFGITVDGNAGWAGAAGLNGLTVVVTAAASGSFMVSSSGNYGSSDLVSVSGIDLRTQQATGLDLNNGGAFNLSTALTSAANAQTALSRIDAALAKVGTAIGTVGAAQSRIDYASANVANLVQNTQAAESVIRDADMAYEMTVFTKNQILQQAGTAMLAQANQAPQTVLKLLQ